jgi:type I restriction enzyme S subunit
MVGYQIYPKYINSGVAWMGDVPEHWVPIRFKHRLLEKKKVSNSGLNAGSISFGRVIFKVAENLAPETKASYQEVLAGEFLINPLNMNYDLLSLRTALSAIDVVVSTGYIVIRSEDNLVKRYVRWLLQEFDVAHMKTLGSGVRQTINYMDIGNSFFYEPPKDEQQKIANFLDHETAKIDTLIDKQQQLITLLKEKRQAVISHAVTKGLNPNAPMRDSGVESIGIMPEHWTLKSLSLASKKLAVGLAMSVTDSYEEEGVPIIRNQNIKEGYFDGGDMMYLNPDFAEAQASKKVKAGDVVIVRTGSNVGLTCCVPDEYDQCHTFTTLIVTPSDELVKEYFTYCMNSAYGKAEVNRLKFGFGKDNLNVGELRSMHALLPSVDEQKEIVSHLEQEVDKIELIIKKANIAIGLMQERRTALISAAVTGKIDVRIWQASAPSNNNNEVVA